MSKKPLTLTEQIRQAIATSGQTCYRIGKATEIDTATLSRFMHGKGGLSMPNLDALAAYLGWTLTVRPQDEDKTSGTKARPTKRT